MGEQFDPSWLVSAFAGIALGVFFIYLAGDFPQTFW